MIELVFENGLRILINATETSMTMLEVEGRAQALADHMGLPLKHWVNATGFTVYDED